VAWNTRASRASRAVVIAVMEFCEERDSPMGDGRCNVALSSLWVLTAERIAGDAKKVHRSANGY
jgi:hypothetical protein